MHIDFYRALEERHRGPRELILQRLRVYLPFIAELRKIYPDGAAIDLGCGRGEWLELMRNLGVEATGVDNDTGMLAACHESGLVVTCADAIEHLRTLPDDSLIAVTGFHIAEHLPFSSLQLLVQESLRVLKPAGVMILETPNPENLSVGSCSFYLDPTHHHPLPPPLLTLLPQYHGFKKVAVLRLQESPDLATRAEPCLLDVLKGVSPDYSVVAQKDADADSLAATSHLFHLQYGVTLEQLASRYDEQVSTSTRSAKAHAIAAEDSVMKARAAVNAALEAATRAQEAARHAEQVAQHAAHADRALAYVYSSRSWRLTRPLRTTWACASHAKSQFSLKVASLSARAKGQALPAASSFAQWILRSPTLRQVVRLAARRWPRLAMSAKTRLFPNQVTDRTGAMTPLADGARPRPTMSRLTPRARKVYVELLAEIEKQHQGT
jgi:O-antigen chain-terminating methyltransferase